MSPIQLALFDLRFPGSEAAVKYQGHVNEMFEQSMVRSSRESLKSNAEQ